MGCAAFKLSEDGFGLWLCSAGAMWDDPASPGLTAFLTAENERQWRAHELELDLACEAELYPATEVMEPEVVPAELVFEWDAYVPRSLVGLVIEGSLGVPDIGGRFDSAHTGHSSGGER